MQFNRRLLAPLAILMLILSACAPVVLPVEAAPMPEEPEVEVLTFDVAEDMYRFVFDQDVVYEDGMPADGSSFITRGYLYPAGTLICDEEGACTGTNADGTPEFPDEVIGEWICQGYMINDAGHASEGVWVFSTQFFQIGDEPGAETVVTQGYELADFGVEIARAITGGSGDYSIARGEGTQTLMGFNASEGVTLQVELAVTQ